MKIVQRIQEIWSGHKLKGKSRDLEVDLDHNPSPFLPFFQCPSVYAYCISACNTPGGKYGYFDVIMVLHNIISYKIITTEGIYTIFFPACLRHLVQCIK